jgi:4-amino-4-deoxy-L-arabinose transferase-like glycosyltransferase
MTGRPGIDLTGFRAALLLALFAAIANGVWILLDHTAPPWDQAHYLSVAQQYQHAFDVEGPLGLLRAIHAVDTSRGPLFPILLTPFLAVFGASARSGMVLNLLLAPVLYLAAGQIAWLVFRSWVARLLTILLVATMPLMVGLFHNVFQDFLLTTLATLSILLLLYSDRFQRRWACVALGLVMGLGTLTKVTFPLFVIGPLLVTAAQIAAARRRSEGDPAAGPNLPELAKNLGLGAAGYLLLVLPWYVPNLSATREYASSTTSGPLSVGAGPKEPLSFEAVVSFTANLINSDLSWIIVLAGIVAIGLNMPALRALLRRPAQVDRLLQLALLLAWAIVPYITLATAHNQDVRLMAAAMPAVAAIIGGAMAAIRWRGVRIALIAVVAIALCYQTLNHTTSVTPGFAPQNASLEIGPYAAVVHLGDEPIGYEQLPGPDYGTPIVDYMAGVIARESDSSVLHSVCVLETEPLVNVVTLGFLATAQRVPLTFVNVLAHEEGTDLDVALSRCDFALYAEQQQPPPAALKDVRMTLVNKEYAASRLTAGQLLALFPGPPRYFPTGPRPEVKGEDKYASVAGKADRVLVLARTSGAPRPSSPRSAASGSAPGSPRG